MTTTNITDEVRAIFDGWAQNKAQRKVLSEEMKDSIESAAEILSVDQKLIKPLFKYLEKEESAEHVHNLVDLIEKFK